MKTAFLISVLCLPVYAGESVLLNGGNTGSLTIPNRTPFSAVTSSYIAGRIDSLTVPDSGMTAIVNVAGLSLFVNGTTGGDCGVPAIVLEDNIDTFSVNSYYICALLPAGATDVFFKFQRDVPNSQIIGEVWNYDSTGYTQYESAIDTLGNYALPFSGTVGDSNSNFHLAFLKWGSGTQPINTQLALYRPVQEQDHANLGSWSFEGDGSDGSGNGLTITFSSPVYGTTPIHNPGCLLQAVSFSTAFAAQLDGTVCYPLDGGTALSYSWSYLGSGSDGVTQAPVFLSTSAAPSTVTGLVRGSFNVQLVVTDGSNHSTTATVHDGVVVTDRSHVVGSMGDPDIDKLYMPLIQWGWNPWPWFDDRQKLNADFFGELQSSTFQPVWNTAQDGTIACENGSTSCTITGANAQTIFCSGGTSSDGSVVIVWYNSGVNRGEYGISACPTPTSLTLATNYRDQDVSGASYSRMSNNDIFHWDKRQRER